MLTLHNCWPRLNIWTLFVCYPIISQMQRTEYENRKKVFQNTKIRLFRWRKISQNINWLNCHCINILCILCGILVQCKKQGLRKYFDRIKVEKTIKPVLMFLIPWLDCKYLQFPVIHSTLANSSKTNLL